MTDDSRGIPAEHERNYFKGPFQSRGGAKTLIAKPTFVPTSTAAAATATTTTTTEPPPVSTIKL